MDIQNEKDEIVCREENKTAWPSYRIVDWVRCVHSEATDKYHLGAKSCLPTGEGKNRENAPIERWHKHTKNAEMNGRESEMESKSVRNIFIV